VRAASVACVAGFAALLWASAPPWPDDWDGIGFVESATDFDLAKFQPHPPGYPVYVALLRMALVLVRRPMAACVLVAVASGVATVVLVFDAARRLFPPRHAVFVAVATGVTPLVWRAASGVGSEAPALAFAAAAAWGAVLARRGRVAGAWCTGIAVGLGIGVRLSWAPWFLPWLLLVPAAARKRAWTAATLAVVAWGLPLLAVVGPRRLVALYGTQLSGHAERWGGTVLTEPGWRRLGWLARDVGIDALGMGTGAFGLSISALVAIAAAMAAVQWRRAGWRGWSVAMLAVGPYLAWVALGQNLRDQPRHVLPLAAALVIAIVAGAIRTRLGSCVSAALVLCLTVRTGLDAHARRVVAPAGQQLVDLVRTQPHPDRIDVFGVTSIRFFERTELAGQALPAATLGDVQVALTRVDRLPARVWITSEVGTRQGARGPITRVATLCRPERIDRRAPCLAVDEWRPPYLPAD
jgi:hypothetical protein